MTHLVSYAHLVPLAKWIFRHSSDGKVSLGQITCVARRGFRPHSNLFAGITIAPKFFFIYTSSTEIYTCQPVARSSRTAPAVQGGTSTSDAIDQTRNARRICFQLRLL